MIWQLLVCSGNIATNGWWYGLVKADHYRTIEEQNLIQPLLTIPLVISCIKNFERWNINLSKNGMKILT